MTYEHDEAASDNDEWFKDATSAMNERISGTWPLIYAEWETKG